MYIAIILFVIIASVLFHVCVRYSRTGRLVEKIPGPVPLPIIGNLHECYLPMDGLWLLLRRWSNEYYPIYRMWSSKKALINLRHPDDVEVLLTSTRHIEKSDLYTLLHPWFGTGLLTSTGAKWQSRRKVLTPAFHFNILQQFMEIFIEESERLCKSLKTPEGGVIKDLLPLLSETTLNAVCETAMGTSLQGRGSFQYKYRAAVHRMGETIVHRLLRPWLHSDYMFVLSPVYWKQKKLLNVLHGFTNEIINERIEYHDQRNQYLKESKETEHDDESYSRRVRKRRLAMLDLLIEASRDDQIDLTGIREEVDTFMFEGHDTTAMALCFTVMVLAEYQDLQERVRTEIENELQNNNDEITTTMLNNCSYLDRFIKESLRLYPSVPFISRTISEDLRLKSYLVPKGTICHVHIVDVHRDPNFWPEPFKFDPDRFLPENAKGRHPFSYIPFSAGPRNCIGQKFAMLEMKTLIVQLLHNYRIEPVDRLSEVQFIADLVLRTGTPLRVKFMPLN